MGYNKRCAKTNFRLQSNTFPFFLDSIPGILYTFNAHLSIPHFRALDLIIHPLPLPLHPHNHPKAGQTRRIRTSSKGDQPPILRSTPMKNLSRDRNTRQCPSLVSICPPTRGRKTYPKLTMVYTVV